jgi:hypothetical protein
MLVGDLASTQLLSVRTGEKGNADKSNDESPIFTIVPHSLGE